MMFQRSGVPSFQYRLRSEHKFPHSVELDRHPDQPPQAVNGDPRKRWLYDCISNPWSVEIDRFNGKRTYYFTEASDAMLFRLKWDHTAS